MCFAVGAWWRVLRVFDRFLLDFVVRATSGDLGLQSVAGAGCRIGHTVYDFYVPRCVSKPECTCFVCETVLLLLVCWWRRMLPC